MADSILRLKVDSQEYDQKIKRAAEGIQQYAQKCRDAGGTLQYLDDGVLEFVQALGKMDTVATGTKQQLREMSNALTTLTQTYRGLTDEEKASPFGQELVKGIQQLTERAGQAQDAMADVQASIRNAASDTRLFDQMAQGMSVATAGFQGLTGAGKLLGIEMGNDVEVIAKLQAAMAVTNSLTTIQTALQKQSALMQGLNAAKTSLAVVAQQAYAVATGEATVAQAAFNVVADANPYGLLLAGIGAVVGAITTFTAMMPETTSEADNMANAMDRIADSLNRAQQAYEDFANSMKEQGFGGQEQYAALYNANVKRIRELKQAGMDAKDPEEKKKYLEEIRKLQAENEKLKKENNERRQRLMKLLRGDFNDLDTDAKVDSAIAFLKDQMKYQKTGGATYRAIERRISELETFWKSPSVKSNGSDTTKTTKTPKATKSSKEPSIEDIINEQFPDIAQAESVGQSYGEQITEGILVGMAEKAQTADVTTLKTLMETVIKNGIDGVDIPADELMSKIIGDGADIPDETWQKLQDEINAKLAEMGIEPIKINFETGNLEKVVKDTKTTTKEWNAAATAISAVGNAMQQIKDPAAKVMGTIAQAIATIALSYAQALSQAASAGPWAWIAFAGTGLATMISTISAIHSSTGYANGGVVHAANGFMVPGNNYSGDLVPAMLNSGELILNRAQQGNLASQLEGGVSTEGISPSYVSGEQIYITLNRYLKRTGRGELMGWKKR